MTAYEPGSFRDPDSAVFRADGKVLRGLSSQAADDWDRLSATAFFGRLTDAGQIVRTTAHDGDAPPSPRGAVTTRASASTNERSTPDDWFVNGLASSTPALWSRWARWSTVLACARNSPARRTATRS